MHIVPVLDLKAGEVVRGIAGERKNYRPIVSRLTPSAKPLDVAQAFRQEFGLSEFYLADLDAIAGRDPAYSVYSALRELGCRIWVDAGVRADDALAGKIAGVVDRLVVGLETIAGPKALAQVLKKVRRERVVFSLDLKNGIPLCQTSWKSDEAWGIVLEAVEMGVARILVLDLRRVGVNEGPGTEELCKKISRAYPHIEIAAGGGIRNRGDLLRLRDAGVAVAIVASALHDGRISRQDLDDL